ncbi:PIG-L family deacetylase [Corynebacterium flavescens]|uniref:PIG-L family deacetylase n=1 Tax=Corynebacterium flavescens TaxID=28028 RepID=UPI003FD6BFB2
MKNRDLNGRRVVAVFAHPDDETLFMGGTLADLAARGADVTVITVTLGELGEIIGEPYQGLIASDQLGGYRAAELAHALGALDVHGLQLGGFGFFHDSGMAGSPDHDNPRALVNRIDEAVALLREQFAILAPDVIFTFGPDGGYGHPDHIAVNQAVHRAAADEQRIWWPVFEATAIDEALEAVDPPLGWSLPDRAYLDNFTNSGADVVYQLPAAAFAAKRAAMSAHATQIWVADGTVTRVNPHAAFAGLRNPGLAPAAYGLSNLLVMPLLDSEHFQLGNGSASHVVVEPC